MRVGGTSGETYFYATDQNGNIIGLVGKDGALINAYKYDPWGNAESASETVAQPLRYAARELDPQTGLYYVRARWYDPQQGRFVSEDPIGLAGGINLYSYAANSPTNLSDPSGMEPCVRTYDVTVDNRTGRILSWRLVAVRGDCDGEGARGEVAFRLAPLVARAAPRPRPTMLQMRYTAQADRIINLYRDFYSRAHEVRLNGHRELPGHDNSTARHQCASFVLADEWGGMRTRMFGIGNEIQGLFMHDSERLPSRLSGETAWAFNVADLFANEDGIWAAGRGASAPACNSVR